MVHADSCSGVSFLVFISINIYICIYSSKANTVAVNLFTPQFLVLPHLHRDRGSWNWFMVQSQSAFGKKLEMAWPCIFRRCEQVNLFRAPYYIN